MNDIKLISRIYTAPKPWEIEGYKTTYQIDGMQSQLLIPIDDGDTDQKALDWLNVNLELVFETALNQFANKHPNLLVSQLNEIEHPHFTIKWNPITKELDLDKPMKTIGTQTAEDLMVESSPTAITPDEAWDDFDYAMKQDRKSLGVGILSTWKLIEDLRTRITKLETKTLIGY